MLPREVWHTMGFENHYLITNVKEKHTFPLAMLLTIWEFRGKTRKLWRYLCTCTHMLMFIAAWHIHTCKTHIYNLVTDRNSSHFPNEAFSMSSDGSSSVWAFTHSSDHWRRLPCSCGLRTSTWKSPGTRSNGKGSTTSFPHQLPLPDLHTLFGCIIIF